jgi:phosphatidate cytidylyltransferase
MKKVVERLLIFIIGIPAIICLVLLLPFYRHLFLNIFIILFSAAGAVEFSLLLEKKGLFITKTEAFILGTLAPAAFTLTVSFNLPEWIIPLVFMAGTGWILLSRAFSRLEKIESCANRIAAGFSILIYPGLFMSWLVKMSVWENSGVILLFLFITFGSDSTAWLVGNLFGANNRGIIAASPNKSIAGFIGGIIGSIIVSGGAALLFPSVFPAEKAIYTCGFAVTAVLLGFFTGIAAALGDLAESTIKRSCGVKDSGTLMPGRGGILDSIDSIAVAAPVFFLLFNIFFANL